MALKGDLASVDLAQVFQMLALNRKVGILNIQGPKAWKALYFGPQGTTLFYNEHVLLDRVLLQMTRTGRLAPQSVQDARDHASAQGMDLIGSLLAGGYVTESDLESAVRVEIEEEVYDLFFWHDAQFEFFEGATTVDGKEGIVDERFFFSTDSLIMEAARRIDEWSYIQERVPGPLEIYRVCRNDAEALQLDDYSLSLFDLTDGKRNIERLTQITGLPAFQVYKGLSCLLDEGLIEPLPEGDLLGFARECNDEGRHHDSINLYEKAIDAGVGIPDAHSEVAEIYQRVEEFELSAYHQKCVAEYFAGSNNLAQAVQTLFAVVEMLPTDLGARERLVELTAGRPNLSSGTFEPVAFGKQLVDLYLETGEVERVRGILEKLLSDNPNDLELKKSLINVHTKAGDTKRVIDLYHSMAEDLVQQRNPIEAIKYLQKILMIDRSRKDISERIRSLYQMDERRRSRRRSLVALGAMLFLLSCMAGGYYFYDEYARQRLVGLQGVIDQYIAEQNYTVAIAKLEQFKRDFPLTLVADEADVEVARIDVLRRKHEARRDTQRRIDRQRLESIRFKYSQKWKEFENLVKNRNLDAGLKMLEEVQVLVDEAGAAEDRRWANDVKLVRSRAELEQVISSALALDRRAWQAYQSGDWRKARELWERLTSEYEMTETARAVRLPVQISTRPTGAQILVAGEPLMLTRNDEQVAAVTPAVVLCRLGEVERFGFQLEGFEPSEAEVICEQGSISSTVLTIVAHRRFSFSSPVQSTTSARHGYLGIGLSGGRVAFTSVKTGKTRSIINLPNMDEIGAPASFAVDRVFFLTKRGVVASHSLPGGRRRWVKSMHATVLFAPQVVDGRVYITDEQGVLTALDASDGRQLWAKSFRSALAGPPTISGAEVRIGLVNGQVLVLDVRNGQVRGQQRLKSGVSTSVFGHEGVQILGTEDGRVLGLRAEGGGLHWQYALKRSPGHTELKVVAGQVFVMDGAKTLVKLVNGVKVASLNLAGRRISGPVVAGDRVFMTLRLTASGAGNRGEQEDLLLALKRSDLSVLWEYRDGAKFFGPVVTDGASAFLPTSEGEVLLFK